METKNYKLTLNMPKTDFPMKADLVNKEIQYRKKWNETKIYKQVLEKNKNKKPFILHDGPPYANGSLHAGHALNKILKDIIIRYKSINNFYTPFIPGWDTHGLPIENKILSQMKINHKQISILELRQKASLYAQEQIEIQKKQFLQLQLLSDFSKIYKTLDKDFEVKQLKVFKKMCLDGLIYKGLKPVYWSCSSQSALADAEVEYYDHVSPSIFVKFPIKKANNIVKENDYLVIWTTTPWTLIANSAIAVNKNFDYSLIEYQNQRYIVAHQLIDQLSKTFQWNDDFKIVNTFKGEQLIGIEYQSIINKNDCLVVEGHHINLDSGSGLVHIAPLFGEDDFLIGKKNNLKMIMHVEDDGTINEQGFEYKGLFYEDANKEIGKFLEENNYLLKLNFIKHQYPHDWRTKKPIIFRGTPQWFVSISKIKSQILKELKDVKFYSNWGYKRLFNMIENRDDWTISRQRIWGVPIIVFYDENKNPVIDEQIFDHVINLIEKHGSNIWYEKDCDQLLPEKYRNKNWTKENDIMDVWFDSGTSFLGVKFDENIEAPYDLYFEGNDQYRGWFNSSLINSVAYLNKAPFKELLSHGFVVDEKGRKMSKSANNGIDPLEIVNNYGAEILRLWASNSEYSNDISISQNIINQNSELYRKIRNTIRFLLSNLYDYQY
ncbi:MAG: isoleucine--tRNA ligase, partial [Mycoplasmataceae bacterium]|nr:isoleucine--tRNA ligase [Mycoplasmataceae bacterium]